MAAWVWLVAYLAGFALLQVLLYRYFQDSRGGQTAPRGSERAAPSPAEPRDGSDGEGIHCQHCGAYNETEFTYCRECAGQL